MSKENNQKLIEAAHDLAHSSHIQWAAFLNAFDDYVGDRCIDAIQAPVDNAHVARGHAQGMLALLNVFKELDARYRAIQESRSRQQKRP